MNEQAKALVTAKTTTVEEKHKGLFQKPIINNEDSEFLQGLQHYAKLSYGLLGSASLLNMQPHCTIKALMGLKPIIRKAMTPAARASIMWILLLQACHTCAGNSMNMLVAKNTNIFYAKVPAALIPSAKLPKKCPSGDLDRDRGSTKRPKATQYNQSNK
eukprot:10994194-Ditylum_brightwellii.AAC.1